MTTVIIILEAIIAIPKIGAMIENWAGLLSMWWLSRQTEKTKEAIYEAAKEGAQAVTKEDRIEALKKWQAALSRPRS